jgi:alkyl sulfatase BDS1-like metallo-beta-lactamase superfamily hydrolase
MELYYKVRTERTVKALIYTHSHSDHYSGAGGVKLGDESTPIIAPDGFLNHAISENIYVGNAMVRRATYMYGDQLPKGMDGQIGTGLGMTSSTGATTLIPPNKTIVANEDDNPIIKDCIDGLEIEYQLTPGTEAPAEMNFFFPQYKALCLAENVTHTMHNIQTLRGALVRNARVWSRYIDESIDIFAHRSEVAFASHHWPTWGKSSIVKFMEEKRDLYAYLHDQTLRMLNNGQTGIEIAEEFKLPPSLADCWSTQGYYGSISHNVKAIYHRYMGWFDGNPAHLWEWPPECGPWRNFFLQGVQELENPIVPSPVDFANAEGMMGLSLEQLMDSIAIRLDGPNMWGDAAFVIVWNVLQVHGIDKTEAVRLTFSHATLTNRPAVYRPPLQIDQGVGLTVWLTHQNLVDLIVSDTNLNGLTVARDPKLWDKLKKNLVTPDNAFAIVTPN